MFYLKGPAHKARAPLRSIETGYLQIVAMGVMGPFPESTAGNSYMSDYFTHILNQAATTVAHGITDNFCGQSLCMAYNTNVGWQERMPTDIMQTLPDTPVTKYSARLKGSLHINM